MPSFELSAGRIDYGDTAPVPLRGGVALVFLHGLHMSRTLWTRVVADLADSHALELRCIAPTLPMGAHRYPMKQGADLSMAGQARLVIELLDGLGLDKVILVGADTGGVIAQIIAGDHPDRLAGLVLTSCEAFGNFPPGLPGRVSAVAATMPGGLYLAMQSLRLKPIRRTPFTWGWMAKRPIPDEVFSSWLAPYLSDRQVRRDTRTAVRAAHPSVTRAAAEQLPNYGGPALVVWAAEDRVMPPEHGRELAQLLPGGRLEELEDCYTLIPLDQPAALADLIREFASAHA